MLKNGLKVINKKGLCYISEHGNPVKKLKPWRGNYFSFLYDFIMKQLTFPKIFGGEIEEHFKLLSKELEKVHGKKVLELATGSGSASNFLGTGNHYTGTDISPSLLKIASKNFEKADFKNFEFFITSADNLPFSDNSFDLCLCILGFHLFKDLSKVIEEIKRTLLPGGELLACVPISKPNTISKKVVRKLFSEDELKTLFHEQEFEFQALPAKNGTLLYFKAVLKQN